MEDELTVFDLFRDTEIRNLDSTFIIDENVRSFDISMDDLSLVEIFESSEDLSNEFRDESFFERAVIRQQGRYRSSWNVLEENVEVGRVGRGVEVLYNVCRDVSTRSQRCGDKTHSRVATP